MNFFLRGFHRAAGLLLVALISSVLVGCFAHGAVADGNSAPRASQSPPRKPGEQKRVTIRPFQSNAYDVTAEAATDMFTAALVKTKVFAVTDRPPSADDALTAYAGAPSNVGAQYIFEGTVTETNASSGNTGVNGTVGGLGVQGSGGSTVVGLSIRVIDARSGTVLDAVNVRKAVKQGGVSVSGIGALVGNVTGINLHGADVDVTKETKQGADDALRACIDEAITQLAARYGQ